MELWEINAGAIWEGQTKQGWWGRLPAEVDWMWSRRRQQVVILSWKALILSQWGLPHLCPGGSAGWGRCEGELRLQKFVSCHPTDGGWFTVCADLLKSQPTQLEGACWPVRHSRVRAQHRLAEPPSELELEGFGCRRAAVGCLYCSVTLQVTSCLLFLCTYLQNIWGPTNILSVVYMFINYVWAKTSPNRK